MACQECRLFEPKLVTSSLQVWSSEPAHMVYENSAIYTRRMRGQDMSRLHSAMYSPDLKDMNHWGSHSSPGIIGTQDQVGFIFFLREHDTLDGNEIFTISTGAGFLPSTAFIRAPCSQRVHVPRLHIPNTLKCSCLADDTKSLGCKRV